MPNLPSTFKELGTFKITAYCPCTKCCGPNAKGITSTGARATEGTTIAVAPSVIPYGSQVYIEDVGYRIAQDTGGFANSNKHQIDLYFNNHSTALNWGVRNKRVWINTGSKVADTSGATTNNINSSYRSSPNSPLVNYTKISPHRSSPRSGKISKITIHHMAGNLSVEGCGACFTGSRQASSNYGIDSNGRVGMYVEEKDRAWTSSSSANDNIAVTIEVADDTNHAPWHSSDKAMAKLIVLCADICRRNGISQLRYTGNTSGNLTLHKWFAATECPGAYLESQMAHIASEVNQLLNTGASTYTWGSATADASLMSTGYVDGSGTPTLAVDLQKFNPFVVTIDPSITDIDYEDLMKKQTCGMLFEAGCLYNSLHLAGTFRNKNLDKQVKSCNEAGLRFALYSIVRSRTVAEAKEECKQLYLTVSKYPPGMGLWLQLEFPKSQSKTRNHQILDYYYEQLTEWGLAKGCGLYATKKDLEMIEWSKYKDKFLLWYKNMFTSEDQYSQAQGLMYPEFFLLDPQAPGALPVVDPNGPTGNTTDGSVIPLSTNIPNLPGNNIGEKIASYACQFIGNKYVYGGNSLTNGVDCSGFTQQVHLKFGISIPRTAETQRSAGKAVSGLSNALPGDIICYSGHVAIYLGGNKIVHASNSKPYPQGGIKITTPANYQTILAIRRCW